MSLVLTLMDSFYLMLIHVVLCNSIDSHVKVLEFMCDTLALHPLEMFGGVNTLL